MDEQPTLSYQREPPRLEDPSSSRLPAPDPTPAPSNDSETASLPVVVDAPPVPIPPTFASLGDRMLGLLMDGLVLVGLFFFVGLLTAPFFGGSTATGFELEGLPAVLVLGTASLAGLLYFVLLEAFGGATLGKLVAGTRVRSTDGGRAGFRRALIRNLMRLIDGICLYLVGALAVLATRRSQRLGDLAGGTIVVQRGWPSALRMVALLGILLLVAAGVAGGYTLRGAPAVDAGALRPSAIAGTNPRFTSLTLTDDRAGSVDKRVFSTTTPAFYLLFTLADVPNNTPVRAIWVAEPVGQAEVRIDEAQVVAGGARANQGEFSLARTGSSWPAGSYRVDLFIAGRPAESVRFRVENGAPGTSPLPGSPVPSGTATR
jgi:uncharacterized RDD family membrane protein YckC